MASIKPDYMRRFAGIVASLIAFVLFVEYTGLLEGINHYFYDLSFRLRGEQEHDHRILIGAIDEKTLAKLGRWPISRSFYANLLDRLDQATAVGFNIILSEPSPEDTILARAIARHGRVVLPVYIDHQFRISHPVREFSSARTGHIHLEQGIDGIVREVFLTIYYQDAALPSFASAVYECLTDKEDNRVKFPANFENLLYDGEIVQSDSIKVNYSGGRETFPYISLSDILEGRLPSSFFNDKIVLVGVTAAGLSTGILTPFTQDRNRMPEVEFQAHVLNNLIYKNYIRSINQWIKWIFAIVFSLFCFLLFIKLSEIKAMQIWLLSLMTVSIAVFMLFSLCNLWLPPLTFYVSLTVSFGASYIFNLEKMGTLLLQAKENWEESFDTINDAITIHDGKCNIIQANKTAEKLFGPPLLELLTERCHRLYHESDASAEEQRASGWLKKEEGVTEEIYALGLDRYFEIKSLPRRDEKGRIHGMVQIARDVTEKKKSEQERQALQSQLMQAQKMEAIGTLAGGIAHDFNNILTAVMGNTEMSLNDVSKESMLWKRLERILKASRRAEELVKQILTFSRRTEQAKEQNPIEVGLIVKEALKLIQSTFPSTIKIHQIIDSKSKVLVDPTQIHQIIMNLCTNAYHAMQAQGGTLRVMLTDVDIGMDSSSNLHNLNLKPGPYLQLSVCDTGTGIPPEIVERIFEPYFTTKEKGIGTGLGLAMVHGVVKNHSGSITVESEMGKGTNFHIYLPRADRVEEQRENDAPRPVSTGSGRVLYVDDEQGLIDIGREILEHYGYEVVTQTSSHDALDLFRQEPDQFDVVVTDMTMPDITGEKLAQEILKIRPDIPVILCTGYSENITEEKAYKIGIKAFVKKPLGIIHLNETIQEILGNN